MSPELISIVVLALMFVVGTVRGINMGVLGFVAAFGVGLLAVGMTVDDVFAGFPVDLFMALLGLTFLFGFAQQNGSIDLLVRWGLRAVRGRVAAAPWIFFALAGVLMSIGAIFAIAIVAPLAIPFARRYKIDQLMMGMMVVHGAMTGAFSPISVYGVFVNGFLASEGLPGNPLALFFASLMFNVVMGVIVYLTMGGRRLLGVKFDETQDSPGGSGGAATLTRTRVTGSQVLTLTALAAMALGTVAFRWDVGVLSLSLAAVLAVVHPAAAKPALANVSWSTVVLVGGVLTYIEVLQTAGTVEYVSLGIAALGLPLVAVLLLCYLSGIVSALASSLGTIGVAVAIAAPFIASGDVNPIGMVAAIAISATVVDVSPFSTNGALVLANVSEDERERFYKRMLVYSGLVVALAPAGAWLMTFVPFGY